MSELPFRVVATDLDGTVVRRDGSIADRTREALAAAEQAGAMVVVVTGRPPRWLAGIADALGHHGFSVCANGAYVYDLATDKVVEEHPIEVEVAQRLVAELRAAIPDVTFAAERTDRQFAHEPAYRPRWSGDDDVSIEAIDALVAEPVAKLLARHDRLGPDELLEQARRVVGEDVATLTHSSSDGLLEISAAGITKASTLESLVAEHGYDASDVLAFGDMPNDLAILSWARHGVAVANAHPDVLAAADEVTASNDDDGVAIVLERLFGQAKRTIDAAPNSRQ